MNALHEAHLAIETFNYPPSREAFDAWKHDVLATLESSIIRPEEGGSLPHAKLSPREREVMTSLLEGRRLKEIAARLEISVKTVTTHRARLLRKLSLEDNLGLYRYGIRAGLIGA